MLQVIRRLPSPLILLAVVTGYCAQAVAADMSARQVAVAIFKTPSGEQVDLTGKNLSELDLAGIDFKAALLARADLYGSDLSRANLTKTDLAGAKLDRAVMTRSNFAGANLEGASILKPSIFTSPDFDIRESPNFADANMKRVRLAARMDGTSFRGADLSNSQIGPFDMSVEGGLAPSSLMKSTDFTGANLSGADIRNVNFTFSRFTGANLTGARLQTLDLTNANFDDADLTGVEFSGCDLQGASFRGAKGLSTIKGLETVSNLDRSSW
jgi:uncharacterized protein YjbI with pentapeptide repeats